MQQEKALEAIEQLQNSFSNIKIFTAVPMGIIMIIYFFTFAQLVDHGLDVLLYIEIVTTIMFVLALIFLNKVAYVLLRLRYSGKQPYNRLLQQLSAEQLGQDAQKLLSQVSLPA